MEIASSLLIAIAYGTILWSIYQILFKDDDLVTEGLVGMYYMILPIFVGLPAFLLVSQFLHAVTFPLTIAIVLLPFLSILSTIIMILFVYRHHFTP
ncbi:hypothetical protein [Geomicrobium sp. JCM 19038]|uniref:hypothetical protein n=1 Tax=Geomicrobium sp. JCM 19038 TaxID=1460635 RepID=UPI00045F1370|nr:hypothetical protein [Geomicrobium sp. JCM 19038]GAK07726.1 hypothetical protein JCM19038_1470 [Geomicrobium sp. JCM 19038]